MKMSGGKINKNELLEPIIFDCIECEEMRPEKYKKCVEIRNK